jgi:formate C-acetyltransferase
LAKLLLYAINGGRDEITGQQVGIETSVYQDSVLNYDEVLRRLKIQLNWLSELYVNTMNVIHYMHDKYAYEAAQFALHDSKIHYYMAFGIAGLSVAADSLSAIKYAQVRAIKDERGLITDFSIDGEFPKFGNDDPRVDGIAASLVEDFIQNLKKYPTYKNADHTLSILTITSNVMYGKHTGTTPDGRAAGQPLAPGANPLHGREEHGALADFIAPLSWVERVDLLPYHALGRHKWSLLGMSYELEELRPPPGEKMLELKKIVEEHSKKKVAVHD